MSLDDEPDGKGQPDSEPDNRGLRRVRDGRRLKPGEVRRAAEALSRYQVRAATRCTPFGLLAGVGVLRFGEQTKVDNGGRHRPGRTESFR